MAPFTTTLPFVMPVISLGDGDDISADQLEQLRDACVQHGFLLLSNVRPDGGHHITPDCLQRAWEVARALFDVPMQAKQAVNIATSTNNRGYFSSVEHAEFNKDPAGIHIKDNKEGFFFGSDSLIAPGNVVPAGLEGLLSEVEEYMCTARDTCVRVMRAIVRTGLLSHLEPEEASPEAFVAKYLADPVYMLKMLKYPATDGNTDAHTDYGCITLLLPGDEGLQVYYSEQWHSVPLVRNAFVINFGDLLQMWSGGRIKSTIHRVKYNNPAGVPRYSIPFFLHPQRCSSINCGPGREPIDSYSYVLDRFDKTYRHRAAAAAATAGAADGIGASAVENSGVVALHSGVPA